MDFIHYERLLRVEREWLCSTSFPVPGGLFIRKVIFKADEAVLDRIKKLLRAVDKINGSGWDNLDPLVQILPPSFVGVCSAPLTVMDENIWICEWRKLSGEEKLRFEEEKGWSASDWLYWLHPEQRTWFIASSEKSVKGLWQLNLITL